MTTKPNTIPAYGNEEDLILNLAGVIKDYLLNGKAIDYVTRHFFYAKNLIAELAKHDIRFRVFYLGAGVRRITTNIEDNESLNGQIVDNPIELSDAEKRELWITTFGISKVRTSAVVEAIKDNAQVGRLFKATPKLTNSGIGTALGRLHQNSTWLKAKPEWVASENQARYFWYAE